MIVKVKKIVVGHFFGENFTTQGKVYGKKRRFSVSFFSVFSVF